MNDEQRIEYLKQIIKESPKSTKARNARWLIKEIKAGQKHRSAHD